MMYWHIGSSKNARATVAMTAVQLAKSSCMLSKKKNMTSSDMDAPRGRHMACNESKVWMPVDEELLELEEGLPFSFSLSSLSPEIET